LAALVLISASLQTFRLSIGGFDRNHYPVVGIWPSLPISSMADSDIFTVFYLQL